MVSTKKANTARTSHAALRKLAGLYGVQIAYTDTTKRRRQAAPASLLAMLRLLGAPVETLDDVPEALRAHQQNVCQYVVEPVAVAWDGKPTRLNLRLPMAQATGTIACHLTLETGQAHHWEYDLARLPIQQREDVEGIAYLNTQLPVPKALPSGYHRLTVEIARQGFETLIVAAPRWAYTPPGEAVQRDWGFFLPLYALHAERSWGAGDFTDLQTLMAWVAELGGGVVATLPVLSTFLNEPYDPSPYVPVSRLFWNEFYIDITRVPGFHTCQAAQALFASTDTQAALTAQRASPLVDYRRQMGLKRRILEILAHSFLAQPLERQQAFQRFLSDHPAVADYAAFRATGEQLRAPWPVWPTALRDGVLKVGDYDAQTQRYHMFVQWIAHEQLTTLATQCTAAKVRLYLDLPLGVHPQGYDVWRERELFIQNVAAGAPPDSFFTQGQNWGFPPLHPEAIRQQHYRYYIASLRQQFRLAGLMRIDHVMGLHRLFCIPQGLEPRQGVYLRYPAEELYGILSLESHRHQVTLVGENLGTVPSYVNTAMDRHHLHRMYVVQYELVPESSKVLRPVPANSVASLNTHDMFPFAAYCRGLDILERQHQGFLDELSARREWNHRQSLLQRARTSLLGQGGSDDVMTLLTACLALLSASQASVVLVNLEDLWLETQPQNIPGTHNERPNWQRKARYSLEEVRQLPQLHATFQALNLIREKRIDEP